MGNPRIVDGVPILMRPIRKRLSPYEKAFIAAYCATRSGTAAIAAVEASLPPGANRIVVYSYATKAAKLLRNPRVRRAIDSRLSATRHVLGPGEVMAELSTVAGAEFRDFAEDVNTVDQIVESDADGRPTTIIRKSYYRVQPAAKVKALEILARVHRLDRDPVLERLDKLVSAALDKLEARAAEAGRRAIAAHSESHSGSAPEEPEDTERAAGEQAGEHTEHREHREEHREDHGPSSGQPSDQPSDQPSGQASGQTQAPRIPQDRPAGESGHHPPAGRAVVALGAAQAAPAPSASPATGPIVRPRSGRTRL